MAGISGGMSVDVSRLKAPEWTAVATGNAKAALQYGASKQNAKNWPNSSSSANAKAMANASLTKSLQSKAKKDAEKKRKAAKKKAKAADLKKDKKNTKRNLQGLRDSGVDSAWLSAEAKKYGKQISSKEAARILDIWNKSRSIPSLPGATSISAAEAQSRRTAELEAANQANILAGKKRDEDWAKFSDVQSQREKAASAYQNQYSTNREKSESTFGDLGDWLSTNVGVPTANATTIGTAPKKSGFGSQVGNLVTKGLQVATDPLGMIPRVSNFIGMNIDNPVTSMANALGLTGLDKNNRQALTETPSAPFVKDLGDVLAQSERPDQPTGYGSRGETYYNNYDPAKDGSTPIQSDFGFGYARPGSEQAALSGIDPMAYGATQRQTQEAFGSQAAPPELYQPVFPGLGNLQPQNTGLSAISGNNPNYQVGGGVSNLGIGNVAMEEPIPGLTPENPVPSPYYSGTVAPLGSENGTVQKLLGSGTFGTGKGNYPQGGMASGFNAYGSPFGSDLQSILDPNYKTSEEQFAQTEAEYRKNLAEQADIQNKIINTGQDIVSSVNPSALSGDEAERTKAVLAMIGNGETTIPTATQNYNLPNTNMANLSAEAGLVAPSVLSGGESKKKKKSKDPYKGWESDVDSSFNEQRAQQEKALSDILAQIESQYGQTTQEGQNTLNKAKQEDLLKLSGMFSFANADPNDEQRVQYQTRTTNDYAQRLSDLIASISKQKEQDILGARSNRSQALAQLAQSRQNQMSQIQQARIAAQQRQKELEDAFEQQQFDNQMTLLNYARQKAGDSKQSVGSLNDLITMAANMPSGGDQWAIQNAGTYGVDPNSVRGIVSNANWGDGYRKASGNDGKTAASYAPDGSYTYGETDPATGKKIFYDPQTGEPFING